MAIITGFNASQQSLLKNIVNERDVISAKGQTTTNASVNNISEIYEKLMLSLQAYSHSWSASLQSSGALIDTAPAQTVLKAVQPLLVSSEGNLQSSSNGVVSDWEIYEDVCNKLDYMQTHYMDIYAQVTEQYQLYMEDVNSFKASLTNYMDNGSDEIYIDTYSITNELIGLTNKWSANPILTVTTQEEANYWADQLGLPYYPDPYGYAFFVNLMPMYDLLDSVNSLSSPVSTARFNQWQNSVNSACSTVESDTQIIAQKYSQANTVFNNLAKILSSTMDALYQTDKEFLRN